MIRSFSNTIAWRRRWIVIGLNWSVRETFWNWEFFLKDFFSNMRHILWPILYDGYICTRLECDARGLIPFIHNVQFVHSVARNTFRITYLVNAPSANFNPFLYDHHSTLNGLEWFNIELFCPKFYLITCRDRLHQFYLYLNVATCRIISIQYGILYHIISMVHKLCVSNSIGVSEISVKPLQISDRATSWPEECLIVRDGRTV